MGDVKIRGKTGSQDEGPAFAPMQKGAGMADEACVMEAEGMGVKWPELRWGIILGSFQTTKLLWAMLQIRIYPNSSISQQSFQWHKS